ncbi:trypsin family protein [Rhodococcus sp. MTM3W5.2]|uniref:S1 family peptidase n=1 Tax=Rhodococcus sp. MTM3W5.2 TaxID=1805827 RepID=UPI00097950DE|nr:S1 family peptidase [Rhodococcus sp. MTM3W5.2]AQA21183.1 trypsin family protein [Rhodococcus sp. MTM3W5.2]
MRLPLAFRAAILASATLLPLSAIAQAEPHEPQSNSPAEVAQQLPAELVDAIARDLKLTPQQYIERAEAAQRLAGYAQTLREGSPATYAGSWMGVDGVPVVAVTTTAEAQRVARDGYATHLAAVSAKDLEGSLAEVNKWILGLPKDVSSQINSTSIDVLENRVVIDVVNSPIGRALNLPTLLAGLKVVLSPGGQPPVDPHAQGGDTYITTPRPITRDIDPGEIGVCSFGFNAVDAAGAPYNLSAGHCDPSQENAKVPAGAPVYLPDFADVSRSAQIGAFRHSAMGEAAGGLDYSVIKLNEAGTAAGLDKPTVRGANGTTVTVTGTARPVIGAPICKSGQTSTFTCGMVLADSVDAPLHMADGSTRLVRGFAGSTCTLGGDSGGAILTGTRALGITSGSNSGGAPNCTEANLVLAPEGGTASIGIPIEKIVNHANATLGLDLQVRAGNPRP